MWSRRDNQADRIVGPVPRPTPINIPVKLKFIYGPDYRNPLSLARVIIELPPASCSPQWATKRAQITGGLLNRLRYDTPPATCAQIIDDQLQFQLNIALLHGGEPSKYVADVIRTVFADTNLRFIFTSRSSYAYYLAPTKPDDTGQIPPRVAETTTVRYFRSGHEQLTVRVEGCLEATGGLMPWHCTSDRCSEVEFDLHNRYFDGPVIIFTPDFGHG